MLFFFAFLVSIGKHKSELPDIGFQTDTFCRARGSCSTKNCALKLPSPSKAI
jgi:hypothetical protein